MSGFDDEIVRDYLAECREHLSGIESDLLAMEDDGAAIDGERVNRVFRAAHSIKGGAGFFNLTRIRDLAHKTENVLDLIRSRRAVASAEVVNTLLLAFDKLSEMIEDPGASEQADISDFVRELESLAVSSLPATDKESVRQTIAIAAGGKSARASLTEFDFDTARKSGKSIYLIEYDLVHDIQRKGKTPLDLLKKLMQYGSLLDSAFHVERAGTLEEEPSNALPVDVLYASCLDTDLIGTVADVPDEKIWKVARTGVCTAVKAPAKDAVEATDAPANHAPMPEVPSGAHPPAAGVIDGKAAAKEHTGATPAPACGESTVRLNVSVLDSLMNLAGELVLCRNQLGEAVARGDAATIQAASQAISLVTSEVEQAVMRTRMQPVANLFQKFTRFVRDTGRKLGKDVQLVIEANEVELDKTIIEGLSDPISHMVRNALDHGVESREAREKAGKAAEGTVFLRAWHEAGLVVVEVADDGRGLDGEKLAAGAVSKGLISAEAAQAMGAAEKLELIFLPGFSTADRVTDLSGRGVGMDVVKTNLNHLGGKLQIHSAPGRGASFRVRLPLTLAIIPSLLVSTGEERVAVPLVNVQNLVRVVAGSTAHKIERVGSTQVLMLRDTLVPLVDLRSVLDIGDAAPDRTEDGASSAINIVLVGAGGHQYGLIVERLHDTMEIVVKPLGKRLKHLRQYAGATILGDGCVALILDIAGVASAAGLFHDFHAPQAANAPAAAVEECHQLLLFQNSPAETCAMPLHMVERVEKIKPERVEYVGGRRCMQYRGRHLPLMALADAARVSELPLDDQLIVIVVEIAGHTTGLVASLPVDVVESKLDIDGFTLRQPGIMGSAILRGRTTLIVDPCELAETLPGWEAARQERSAGVGGTTILYAEDSTFFREHTGKTLRDAGYTVLGAADGQEAWEILGRRGQEIQLVLTDVEMPRLDGLQLAAKIRGDRRWAGLPVVMLTSLASEEDIARGQQAGATTYCIKLDRDQLLTSIQRALGGMGTQAVESGVRQADSNGLAQLSRHVSEASETAINEAAQRA